MSYPRAPGIPGPQRVTVIQDFCWLGSCFEGGNVHYVDFAMVVAPGMSESLTYLPGGGFGGPAGRAAALASGLTPALRSHCLPPSISPAFSPRPRPPGYTLVLRNTTRMCASLVPDSCLQTHTRDQCLVEVGGRGWAAAAPWARRVAFCWARPQHVLPSDPRAPAPPVVHRCLPGVPRGLVRAPARGGDRRRRRGRRRRCAASAGGGRRAAAGEGEQSGAPEGLESVRPALCLTLSALLPSKIPGLGAIAAAAAVVTGRRRRRRRRQQQREEEEAAAAAKAMTRFGCAAVGVGRGVLPAS
jgi:hypothetical protein